MPGSWRILVSLAVCLFVAGALWTAARERAQEPRAAPAVRARTATYYALRGLAADRLDGAVPFFRNAVWAVLAEPAPPPRRPRAGELWLYDDFVLDAAQDVAAQAGEAELFVGPGGVAANPVVAAGVGEILGVAAAARGGVVGRRQQAAVAAAGPGRLPVRTAEEYARLAIRHTPAPQNTHDSAVLGCMRETVARLRKEAADLPPRPLSEIGPLLDARGAELSEGRPGKVRLARGAYEQILASKTLVVRIGATDRECAELVWQRAHDPRNAQAQPQMVQAIFNALVDCWEDGAVVCANGRAGRMLGALVMLDHDPRNWVVISVEDFKNLAFERAARVSAGVAERAAASPDPATAAAGRAALAKTAEEAAAAGATAAASSALAAATREAIAAAVRALADEVSKNHGGAVVPELHVQGAVDEAVAAVAD